MERDRRGILTTERQDTEKRLLWEQVDRRQAWNVRRGKDDQSKQINRELPFFKRGKWMDAQLAAGELKDQPATRRGGMFQSGRVPSLALF